MSRATPEINTVYICKRLGFKDMKSKSFVNYAYTQNGLLLSSGPTLIHRYAKDYEIDNQPFTMIIVTDHSSEQSVEKFMDKTHKKIKNDNKYKSIIEKAEFIPTSLEITYGA
jgi:hypothetical protein